MNCSATAYMPNGTPCPYILTEDELIVFLRLDQVQIKRPHDTIRRYRDAGRLRGVQISHRVFYRLKDVLDFVDKQAEAVQR